MSDCFGRERSCGEQTRRSGSVAACAVLLVAHQFLPAAMAGGDLICYSRADFNCDWVVDGQDLSYVLGSWGTSSNAIDLDGNCTIDGGDLAIVLGSWGALPEMPDFVPFAFYNEPVSLCLGGDSLSAVLDGELFPDPYSNGYFGEITVELESSVHVSIQYNGDQTTVMTGMSKILIDGSDPASTLYLNGVSHPVGEVLDDMASDFESYGYYVSEWDEYSQGMMAHSMLFQSSIYMTNMVAAQNNAPGAWCKAAAIAAGAAITALATAGCLVLTGSCAVGTTVTFGGIAIPCTGLIALCAGGVFVGGAGAYELALAYWGD